MMTEAELEEMMLGYQTVEPKSEPFERMAETLRLFYKLAKSADEFRAWVWNAQDAGKMDLPKAFFEYHNKLKAHLDQLGAPPAE